MAIYIFLLIFICIIVLIIILAKLILSVFKITKALEGIDETLYMIYKDMNKKDSNEPK